MGVSGDTPVQCCGALALGVRVVMSSAPHAQLALATVAAEAAAAAGVRALTSPFLLLLLLPCLSGMW